MQEHNETEYKFLDYIFKNEINILIFLINGIKLAGKVTDFDKHSLILNNPSISESKPMLVYKQAISTIVPQGDISSVISPTSM